MIEDPDPDNPYHASQLYAKIRELAPAGPMAFRLASFFDAQTGELLARQSNDSGQSAVDPSLDMFEGIPGIHEDLEPMDGGRPTLDDELVPSDPPIRVQTASSTSEVRSYVLEEARTHERESPSSGVQMDNFPGQVNLGGSHPFDVPSVPAAETSETELASDTLSISGPADGNSASACFGGSESRTIGEAHASANLMHGWVRSSDPIGEFRSHQETINGWGNRHQTALNRYGQWQKLPFEDWGYGHSADPPCTAMAFVHRLHVADGFLQGTDLGVDRLEMDMEAWRTVLGQARTLAVKMLAMRAINDDIAVASGLLVRSDFDGKYLGRITKFLRPFGQTELSLRWPMQNELVSASRAYENQLRAARAEEQPMYRMVASALPLPVQRRLNDYADYYDASYKAAGEGRYGSLPKRRNYIHFPASGLMDYLTNPIENIVGLEPLASWDLYNGFVVDTDAHLRLAGLQAWLRRGPPEGDLLTRIAKAGQGLYDPYTGLPMLVNMKKGALYSVGHDGKDQDADPQSDVVVKIPAAQMSSSPAKPSVFSR